MVTENIVIIVSEKGTVTVKKNLADVGKTAKQSATDVGFLNGAIAALVSGQAINSLLNLADAGTQLTNSLKVAGFAGEELADQQAKLFQIAKDNGQNVNELAGVYQKLTSVQGQLGASNSQLDKTMVTVAASMKLSSASASAQAGALQQLSQLFGGVNVQAQEYNSLIDGAYPLLQAVAAGSDKWRGSVAALTADVRASKVSTKEFFDALLEGGDANVKLAASFNLTIGQALTNFRTNMIQAVLAVNNATGAFAIIANTIDFLGNHLILLGAIITPLIVAITVLAVRTLAGSLVSGMVAAAEATGVLIAAMSRLFLMLLANPFTALIAALVIIIGYYLDWKKAIVDVIDATGKLIAITGDMIGNDAMRNVGIEIVKSAKEWGREIAEAATDMAEKAKRAIIGGGATAATALTNGMVAGANKSREILKAGTEEFSKATYEALNGVPQKIYGAIQTGSDYQYNQITGAVTRSSDTGAQSMYRGIVTGGQTAAQAMGSAITAAGSAAAREMAIQAAQALQASRGLPDTGGGAFSPGAGPGGWGTFGDDRDRLSNREAPNTWQGNRGGNLSQAIRDALNKERENKTSDGNYSTTSEGTPLTIVNQLDPQNQLDAIDTAAGHKTIINVIKANAQAVGGILGVV